MTEEIQPYADAAMFRAEPMGWHQGPKVHLLHMTADPLGAAAAANMMYRGIVVRNLVDVPDDERHKVMDDMSKTRLTAPLEFIDLHFMVEGVTRAFTHQMVRQRTAVYAQESLRFGVKEGEPWGRICAKPPSIDDAAATIVWEQALNNIQDEYQRLITWGIPAEDARGLMPHAMTTRLHYKTNLRNLVDHVGNRLCTQAQFEWRQVAMGFADAIRNYRLPGRQYEFETKEWQYEAIANSWMFSPVCYQTGKCEFMASADRFCSIRDRVEAFHQIGVKPEWWDARMQMQEAQDARQGVPGIFPAEWLVDATSAREV